MQQRILVVLAGIPGSVFLSIVSDEWFTVMMITITMAPRAKTLIPATQKLSCFFLGVI